MELNKKTLIQLEQFEEACQRLTEAIAQPKNEFTRDSVIQRFEFCFEMAWKLLQSVLLFLGKECASPRQCIRLAAQNSLLADPERWLVYQDARNLSSHTYKEKMAEEVYAKAVEFVSSAKQLAKELRAQSYLDK